jgi:hypothetical protein
MTLTEPTRRPPVVTRRVGYVVAVVVDAALLYLVNVWPGWQAVSLLTEDTRHGACPARHQRGDTIAVAYDPQQVNSVDLASRVVGRHPLLDPRVLALVLMSVSFLVAAAVNMVRSP